MKNATFYLVFGLFAALFTACSTQKPFLENGLQALKSHRYEEAVVHFSNALKTDSRNVEALMGRGKAYYFMNDDTLKSDEKAYLDFQKVTLVAPENATAFACAANAKRKLQQKYLAKDLIEKALQLDPRCAIAHCVQSRILLKEEAYDEALSAIHQAIQLDSADAYIWFCKGLAHNKKEQYAKAVEAFNRAIDLDPLDASSYNNRAFAKQEQKKYFDAIEDYTRAIDLDPTHSAYAYGQRGWVKSTMKRYEEAIADYDKSISLDSTDAWVYFQRGYAKGELKKHKAAITDYDRAIALNPEDDMAFNNRGWEYQKLGNNQRAKSDYAEAARINPKNKLARENLSSLGIVPVSREGEFITTYRSCVYCRGTCKASCSNCSGAGNALSYKWESKFVTEYDPFSGQTQVKEEREYLPSNAICSRCNGSGKDPYISCPVCGCRK